MPLNTLASHPIAERARVELIKKFLPYLNYSRIAASTGLHPTYVSRVLRGVKTPALGTLKSLSATLGVPYHELEIAINKGGR